MTWLAIPMPRLPQHQLGKGSGGHAGGRFARRSALQHVAGVGKIVLEGAGQVGVAGTRRSDGLVFRRVPGLHGQLLLPVLPVAVHDLDGDGGADGLAVAHSGEHMGLVRLDLHASAAAIALLTAPKLAVNELEIDRHAGGNSGDQGDQGLPVGLPGSGETDHNFLIVTGKGREQGTGIRDQTDAGSFARKLSSRRAHFTTNR